MPMSEVSGSVFENPSRPIATVNRLYRADSVFRVPEPYMAHSNNGGGALRRMNAGLEQFENFSAASTTTIIGSNRRIENMPRAVENLFETRRDISERHGVMFGKLFHNLTKQMQMELRSFLTTEMIRHPLKMLPLAAYPAGRQQNKVRQYNELMGLNYERSICTRFLYEQKIKFRKNIAVATFYKFLMAGSIGKQAKYDMLKCLKPKQTQFVFKPRTIYNNNKVKNKLNNVSKISKLN